MLPFSTLCCGGDAHGATHRARTECRTLALNHWTQAPPTSGSRVFYPQLALSTSSFKNFSVKMSFITPKTSGVVSSSRIIRSTALYLRRLRRTATALVAFGSANSTRSGNFWPTAEDMLFSAAPSIVASLVMLLRIPGATVLPCFRGGIKTTNLFSLSFLNRGGALCIMEHELRGRQVTIYIGCS